MNPRRRALALVLAAAPAAALRAQAPASLPFSQGVLWRLSRGRAPASHLFGTVHLADPRIVAMALEIEPLIAGSRALAMERIVDDLTGPVVQPFELLPAGQRLETLIGAEAMARARAGLAARGVPDATIPRLKPWAALLRTVRQPVLDAEASLDERILALARARRLRTVRLEWPREQAAAFDAVPLPSQVAVLVNVLEHPQTIDDERAAVIDAWLRGDLEALWRFPERAGTRHPGIGPHYLQFARHVVQNRTALMYHRLLPALGAGSLFVAVGAEHLPGPKGMLAAAQRDGHALERLL